MQALFGALSLLKDSLIYILFFYILLAITGLHLFSGSMKKRCFNEQTGMMSQRVPSWSLYPPLCSESADCEMYKHDNVNYICGKMVSNPNHGYTNFDSFGSSLFQIFQVNFKGNILNYNIYTCFFCFSWFNLKNYYHLKQIITLEGWGDIAHYTRKTNSEISFIFFVLTVVVGAFLLINLTLAIIKVKYSEAQS